ncbi:UNVERIFIED_CONTAM: hypothetical protein Sindi_2952200 [Sesamum indicum]
MVESAQQGSRWLQLAADLQNAAENCFLQQIQKFKIQNSNGPSFHRKVEFGRRRWWKMHSIWLQLAADLQNAQKLFVAADLHQKQQVNAGSDRKFFSPSMEDLQPARQLQNSRIDR